MIKKVIAQHFNFYTECAIYYNIGEKFIALDYKKYSNIVFPFKFEISISDHVNESQAEIKSSIPQRMINQMEINNMLILVEIAPYSCVEARNLIQENFSCHFKGIASLTFNWIITLSCFNEEEYLRLKQYKANWRNTNINLEIDVDIGDKEKIISINKKLSQLDPSSIWLSFTGNFPRLINQGSRSKNNESWFLKSLEKLVPSIWELKQNCTLQLSYYIGSLEEDFSGLEGESNTNIESLTIDFFKKMMDNYSTYVKKYKNSIF